MKGVDFPLRGGFSRVNRGFIVKGLVIEVNEVGGSSSSSGGAVSGVVSYLSTLETRVIGCLGRCLGDAVPRRASLLSPLVRGPGPAKVHRYWLVIEGARGGRRVYRGHPVSNGVSVSGSVGWGPSPHILLGMLEELLRRLSSLLGCATPVPGV